MAYFVQPNLRICFNSGDAVILDLARNRYSTIPGIGAAPDAEGRFAALLQRRFGAQTCELRRIDREPACAELVAERRPKPKLKARDWARFARACALGEADVRSGRLDLALARASRRVSRAKEERQARDLDDLLARFAAMRPWWPRKRKCLFEAIALGAFLASFGIAADLVFGVRSKAFAAHCWIECDGVVVNDDLERIGSYTKICWS